MKIAASEPYGWFEDVRRKENNFSDRIFVLFFTSILPR